MNARLCINTTVAIGLAALVALPTAFAGDVILTGNVLKVGVNDGGGLIDSGFVVGINQSAGGTGVFPAYDYLKPGSPWEFWSVGVGGASYEDQGYSSGNPLGGTTANTSAGSVLSTTTSGLMYNGLSITQDLAFTQNGGTIDFSVTLLNTNNFALNQVAYARGLDPDQDVFAGGDYYTSNAIVSGNLVTASAPITDWTIGIFSDSMYPHTPTVRSSWPYSNPYGLLTPRNDGFGDYSINMAWDLGTFAAGETKTVTFQYRIAESQGEVVNPGEPTPDAGSTAAMFGLATLIMGACMRRFGKRA